MDDGRGGPRGPVEPPYYDDPAGPPPYDPRYGPAPHFAEPPPAAYPPELLVEHERTLELREEQLVARKEMRPVGEVTIRTEVEDVPGRLEVDAYREEVEVEHVPLNTIVQERKAPYEEDGVLVVPVYEEQIVAVKRLVLREELRIRRVGTTERRLYEDVLRRERLVIDDDQHPELVHERYPTDGARPEDDGAHPPREQRREEGGLLENLARKMLG